MKRKILKAVGEWIVDPPDLSDSSTAEEKIRNYFKKLRIWLVCGLMVCFILPHAVLSAYFHFQFTSTLRSSGRLNLMALSESQRNTIDLFLQERVINLFSFFHGRDFNLNPTERQMASYLQNLRQVSDAFVDVGFLNTGGVQIGYSGPYPYLQGRNYSHAEWFNELKQSEKEYVISDIYLGFRHKPHFTIAVKQSIDGAVYIVRATLDPDKFYMFLRTISHGKEVESALINEEGRYQIVDPGQGKLLGKSEYVPPVNSETGVEEIEIEGDAVMMAYTWLQEAEWALLVRQPLKIVHAQMYRARSVMTLSLMLILMVIGIVIIMTTITLVNHAQAIAEKSHELQSQLLHAAKLASIGELATGVAHEINNPLAIILATSGLIRDKLNPEFEMDANPEGILQDLDIIDSAGIRASRITGQLLDFGRKGQPTLIPCDINQILNNVLDGLIEYELNVENVRIERKLDENLSEILMDPDQIKQVFINLINNASDAIVESGIITVSTTEKDEYILVTIKDTGSGISQEQIDKIYDPFYTTKDVGKGTGLGLSVSLGIVESLGGRIELQSIVGSGSSFTIFLPLENQYAKGSANNNGE
jgi:two-component system NtrC family sensor kinase